MSEEALRTNRFTLRFANAAWNVCEGATEKVMEC
mgnify:CR=1 FL=1